MSSSRRRLPVREAGPLDAELGVLPDGSPLAAFLPQLGTEEPDSVLRARAALSSTLIAGLELARDGVLALDQDAAWTPVRVRRHENRTGDRPA